MIRSKQTPVGETLELGSADIGPAVVQRYWRSIGLPESTSGEQLPLGLALALRGGPIPGIELETGTVSFHAGHTIIAHQPFVGGTYRVRARISDIFEKSGRSGALTVVVRSAELCSEDGAPVVAIREQQIARWNTAGGAGHLAHAGAVSGPSASQGADDVIDVGATIGVERRPAPTAAIVRAYGASLGGSEPFFSDADFARGLGFADVIVPGPMQSALFEALLARNLPGWRLAELSLTFRVSVIAGEPIVMSALVVERDQAGAVVADLTLENSSGERAATGIARLHPRR
jgi:acyl dehydratase